MGRIILPSHTHKFTPLKRGFPQKICACGTMAGISSIKVGKNTIDVGAAGAGDVIRWSGAQAALAAGDLAMDTVSGRPRAFIEGESRDLGHIDEGEGGGRRRMFGIQQNANLTTTSQVGFVTAPTVNTPGAGAAVHNDTSGNGQFIEYASTAAIDSDAGWLSSAFSQTQRIYRYTHDMWVKTGGAITTSRIWMGMFSATPMAAADPAIHAAAFRYDTVADGTAFWRTYTNDGTTTGTVTVTTTAIAVDTAYRLRIVWAVGTATVRFYINGVNVANHTTDLPTTTQNLGHVEQIRALAAASRIVRIGGVWVSQNAAA